MSGEIIGPLHKASLDTRIVTETNGPFVPTVGLTRALAHFLAGEPIPPDVVDYLQSYPFTSGLRGPILNTFGQWNARVEEMMERPGLVGRVIQLHISSLPEMLSFDEDRLSLPAIEKRKETLLKAVERMLQERAVQEPGFIDQLKRVWGDEYYSHFKELLQPADQLS